MSAMCVVLDPQSGRAKVVGAGHPPLLVIRFGRGTEAISSSAPPLGLVEQSNFVQTEVALSAGDSFALYTDGLFGPSGHGQPQLTPTQLAGALNPFAASAQAVLERMLATASSEKTGLNPDDVAAIVVRRAS